MHQIPPRIVLKIIKSSNLSSWPPQPSKIFLFYSIYFKPHFWTLHFFQKRSVLWLVPIRFPRKATVFSPVGYFLPPLLEIFIFSPAGYGFVLNFHNLIWGLTLNFINLGLRTSARRDKIQHKINKNIRWNPKKLSIKAKPRTPKSTPHT